MANANPLTGLWKSKKYVTAIVWSILCIYLASQTTDKLVVSSLIQSASIVLAAYLVGQGYVDAHRTTNGG